jgi:hypothetical protein
MQIKKQAVLETFDKKTHSVFYKKLPFVQTAGI